MTRSIEFIRSIIERLVNSNTYGKSMKCLKILSAENGRCKAEFKVTEEHTNLGGSLHGGFTATVIDCVSSYALMTHERRAPGVSVDLHITYMKAAFPGELVTVDAKTVRFGKNLAFLAIDVTKNEGKDVVAHGLHTKFVA